MARILAIDYGKKRTGLAVTDVLQIIANGLTTVPTHTLMDYILDYVKREPVERIVVGLPKQMNNQPSEAHQAMLDGGLKKKDRQRKELVDEISATIILQSYMESRKAKGF